MLESFATSGSNLVEQTFATTLMIAIKAIPKTAGTKVNNKKRSPELTFRASRKSGDDLLSHKAASERSEGSRFVDASSS